MALNTIRWVTSFKHRYLVNKVLSRHCSLYEPNYLQVGKPKEPVYTTLNIQIKGYVFSVLESYQAFVDKLLKNLDLTVDSSWAMPPKILKVQKYKSNSTVVAAEYNIDIYERNIEVSDVTSIRCPILIRMMEASLPEGVSLKVEFSDEEYSKKRFIPDHELLELQTTLEDLKKPKK